MRVDSLVLEGFRNYAAAETTFDPGVNVILGENAQGKTNLLEAVYMLTCGRSFRERSDRNIIGFDRDEARILAGVRMEDRDQKIEVRLGRGLRKQIFVNDVRLRTAAKLTGRLTAVLFCPDDLHIIRDSAASRRRLMDMCISQLRPKYAAALAEYGRMYEHKTRILRDFRERPDLLDTLEEFNAGMARLSAELIWYRAHFVKKLRAAAAAIHMDFSDGRESLGMEYRTVKTIADPLRPPAELLPALLEHQAAHARAELETGACLSGAHKDDLDITINGLSAKNFASQGQTRTAALSIKLAEREIHYEDRGEYPLLLLDDVLSELDRQRQGFVLNRIAGGQVLITCCEDMQIADRTGGRILRIEEGEIR